MERELTFAHRLVAEFNKMFVVREQENLSPLGEIGELRKHRLRSLIVERHQEIIQNERHWLVVLQITIHCCKPKGEIELISGSVTHPFHRNIRPIRPAANHYRNVRVIEFRRETVKGISRHLLEHLSGFFQQVVPDSLRETVRSDSAGSEQPVAGGCIGKHPASRLQPQIPPAAENPQPRRQPSQVPSSVRFSASNRRLNFLKVCDLRSFVLLPDGSFAGANHRHSQIEHAR